jgi:hypothetical protein
LDLNALDFLFALTELNYKPAQVKREWRKREFRIAAGLRRPDPAAHLMGACRYLIGLAFGGRLH